ncbi:MAG: ribonuclease III [Flavobacteriales bacterium]
MVFRGRSSREARIKRFIRRHFGVRVRSLAPYEEALRHSSSVACQRDGLPSNERLEFLGDSVLDMIVVDMLFGKFPKGDEGAMTRMKSRLVSRESLNFLGQEIGVEHLLDAQTGKGAVHASLRGNAMEALVGAVYLDKGFTKTQKGVLKLLGRFDLDERIQARVDFKSKLHEWGQKRKKRVEFKVIREFKRDGEQRYQMQVKVGGKVMGSADGPSKKTAEQAAARVACRHIFGDD